MKLSKAIGRIGNDRGRWAERRTLEALRLPTRPKWIQAVRPATYEQDQRGIDIVIDSDVGELYLQVKASRPRSRQRKEYEVRWIAVTWSRPGEPLEVVEGRAACMLGRMRRRILDRRIVGPLGETR